MRYGKSVQKISWTKPFFSSNTNREQWDKWLESHAEYYSIYKQWTVHVETSHLNSFNILKSMIKTLKEEFVQSIF